MTKYWVELEDLASYDRSRKETFTQRGICHIAVYLAPDVDAAIAQAKREVWEKAAVLLEDDCYGGPAEHIDRFGGDVIIAHAKYAHNQSNVKLAKMCRQQAKEST